jgi:hypothetical protein
LELTGAAAAVVAVGGVFALALEHPAIGRSIKAAELISNAYRSKVT